MMPREKIPTEIEARFVLWPTIYKERQLGSDVLGKHLLAALAASYFKPDSTLKVVGNGLEAIQTSIEKLVRVRSHTKLVLTV